MAHLRVLQIVKGSKNEGDTLKLLPGTFKGDRQAHASIKENGDYLFLEVHSVNIKKGKENGNDATKQDAE